MRKHITDKEMQELDKMLQKRYPSAYAKYQVNKKAIADERREQRIKDKA